MTLFSANTRDSIWVFTLLAIEAMKTYRSNPFFEIAGTKIPTWVTPLGAVLVVWILIPNTSFLGHICGLAFGYGCELPFIPSFAIVRIHKG